MRKPILPFLILLFTSLFSNAQYSSKLNFSLMKMQSDSRVADREVSLFVKGDIETIKAKTIELGGVFKYAAGDIAAIRIRLSKLKDLAALSKVLRIENNDLKLQSLNDQMIYMNNVVPVQSGWNLPQGYDGSGVVLGVVDEGIDYTHPDFRDISGHTRIKFLWDQAVINLDTATQAHPYGYGVEYVGNQIDTSTKHYDGPYSHGSHVTGIAAGNGLSVNNYKGVAPKADLIIVKINLNQPDNDFLSNLVDAVKYIFDHAELLGEPAVINLSIGTYYGSHDAKDIQAQAIENLVTAQPGRAIVCAAGNKGPAPIHLGYDVTSDTAMTWYQYTSQGIYFQLWGDSGNFENVHFSVGIDRINDHYQFLGSLPFNTIGSHVGIVQSDTLWSGSNRLGIIQSFGQYLNGSYLMEYYIVPDSTVRFIPDTTLYFWRLMTTGSGHLDSWSENMVFDNLPDSLTFPPIRYYMKPDTSQNIVSSFSCSNKILTVGSYTNRNYYTNSMFAITSEPLLTVGALSDFTSHGPTRDGRIKPEITATGGWLLSCGTQSELNILSAVQPDVVAAGKKHKRSSGTSMASPVVAGIVALYFQKNPTANWQDVRNAVLNCTDKDGFTGNNLPNNIWGYGKVNAYKVLTGCAIGIDDLNSAPFEFGSYPNPFSSTTSLHYDLTRINSYSQAEIKITDALGKTIRTIMLKDKSNSIQLDCGSWESGIYFCSLIIDGRQVRANKLVIL